MTPPENPERRGATGSADPATGADAAPPWQRLAKDSGNGAADQGGEQWPAAPPPAAAAEETAFVPASGPDPAEHQTVVTGSAARRLFGDPADTGPQAPLQDGGMFGREPQHVGAAPQAKGRTAPTALRRPGRGPRRASLQIKRFDPWSVLKLSLVLGVAMFFVWLVAVGVLYTVLDGMGVWDQLNGTYTNLVQGEGTSSAAEPLISAGRVFGVAAVLGAINIVLVSALATVMAFIYNVSADLAGGLEVTLSERE
ncbi:DUF3566 domain-containing protein [Amycolatopsis nigrescens]|uniref:DUF3566 domain-containing protein n=1 Tax=Amycolatopsis nigrescens TaxID=381445 RepID=UPI0003715946|nr:DUF3566 domain-containing protein [Amycolatopsis nigrescens]